MGNRNWVITFVFSFLGLISVSSCGYVKKGTDAELAVSAGLSVEGLAAFQEKVNPLLREHCAECHANDISGRDFATIDIEHNYKTARPFINILIPAEDSRLAEYSSNNHCFQSNCNHSSSVFGEVVAGWIAAESSAGIGGGNGGNGGGGITFDGSMTASAVVPAPVFSNFATMSWNVRTIDPALAVTITAEVGQYFDGYFIRNVSFITGNCNFSYNKMRMAINGQVAPAVLGSETNSVPANTTLTILSSSPTVFAVSGYRSASGDSLAVAFDEVECE